MLLALRNYIVIFQGSESTDSGLTSGFAMYQNYIPVRNTYYDMVYSSIMATYIEIL